MNLLRRIRNWFRKPQRPYVPRPKRWVMLEGGKRNGEVVETSEGIHTIIGFEFAGNGDIVINPGAEFQHSLDYNIREVRYKEDSEREGIFVYQENTTT